MTLKIQTDDLEKIKATSADNIEMEVTSTMNWKITDVITAATNAAETMASSGIAGDVSADITKLRMDVRKQAIASLAGFIGGVNYSETFHMSADNQRKNAMSPAVPPLASVNGIDQAEAKVEYSVPSATAIDNPMFDAKKMYSAVEHANAVTRTYGVEVLSINIISASPIDASLTRALASGAVASAEALQAETTARGNARAATIVAENDATCSKINASGKVGLVLLFLKLSLHFSHSQFFIQFFSRRQTPMLFWQMALLRPKRNALKGPKMRQIYFRRTTLPLNLPRWIDPQGCCAAVKSISLARVQKCFRILF